MRRISSLILIFFAANWGFAQDPGGPDTIYFEASGLHSLDGNILYTSSDTFPSDVAVDVWAMVNEGVCGVSLPFVDTCYDTITMPTHLDPMKNDPDSVEPNCYTGTVLEDYTIAVLNLYGTTTPTPPNFLIGAIHFSDSFGVTGVMDSYKLAHLIFTVSNEGCICLDTISSFEPGGATPGLTGPAAQVWIPKFRFRCFEIRKGELPFFCGDVNTDVQLNLADPIFLANYLFKGGKGSFIWEAADVDCNGVLDTSDVIILAKYILGVSGFELCCM